MSHAGKVVLGVTGSIAAVKAPELVRLFIDKGFDVTVVMTKGADNFVSPMALATFCKKPVVSDLYGADAYLMPHLEAANDADVMVIAPAAASVLGRCATGISDDMVTLTYLSTTAPTLIAPAMHTTMWEHPATQANVKLLKERGVTFIGPYQGPLADASRGEGRMAEPKDIVAAAEQIVAKKKK